MPPVVRSLPLLALTLGALPLGGCTPPPAPYEVKRRGPVTVGCAAVEVDDMYRYRRPLVSGVVGLSTVALNVPVSHRPR